MAPESFVDVLPRLAAFLLTYLIHSTVLLGSAWLLVRALAVRSPAVEDGLWKAALVGGLLAATLQVGFGLQPLGGMLRLDAPPGAAAAAAPAPSSAEIPLARRLLLAAGVPVTHARRLAAPVAARDVAAAPQVVPLARATSPLLASSLVRAPTHRSPERAAAWSSSLGWTGWLVLGWLAVAGVLLLRWVVRLARLRAVLTSRRPLVDGPLPALLDQLKTQAGIVRPVRLSCSPVLGGPVALSGWEICVPRRALSDLSPRMQEAMLAHELAHLLRRDPAWLLFCGLLEALFFVQPLNRLGRARLAVSSELLCDDWAVRCTGQGVVLARCLAEVARWVVAPRGTALLAGMVAKDSTLLGRVERLLAERSPRPRRRPWVASLGTGVLLAIVACGVPGVATHDKDEPSLLVRLQRAWEILAPAAPAAPGLAWGLRSPAPAPAAGDEPLVLRLRDGRIVGARYGDQELLLEADRLHLQGAGRVQMQDGVLSLEDAQGRTRIVLELQDGVPAPAAPPAGLHAPHAPHAPAAPPSAAHPPHAPAAPPSAPDARALEEQQRQLERVRVDLEREFERARGEVERAMQRLDREFERQRTSVERQHEHAVEDEQRAHEHELEEFELSWAEQSEALEHAYVALEERRERDELAGDDWLRATRDWEASWADAERAFEEQIEDLDVAWEDRMDLLDADFESLCWDLEAAFEASWADYDGELEALESELESACEAWELHWEELLGSADFDCDHDCAVRCAGGCTHPEDVEPCDESAPESVPEVGPPESPPTGEIVRLDTSQWTWRP